MQDMAGSLPADLTVLRNGEPEYDRARAVFNLAGVPAPAEAVIARTVDEVRYAAAVGRPVRVLSTGSQNNRPRPLTRPKHATQRVERT